jgi:hypothetical protein
MMPRAATGEATHIGKRQTRNRKVAANSLNRG